MGHDWDKPTYTLNDGKDKITGKRVCKRDGSHYETETQSALGYEISSPTCTTNGKTRYSAIFSETGIPDPSIELDDIPALGHDLTATAKVEPACTTTGMEAYWTCTRDDCDKLFSDAEGKNEIESPVVIKALGHDWGEWHVTKAPQIGKAGERQRTCSCCVETETEAVDALIGYSVTGGADGNWTKGSGAAHTITVKRSEDDASCFAHYAGTLIDGNPVTVSAKAGSTVVTIGADTLEKLSAGTHTVTVNFDDGQATTTLTVKNRAASTDSKPSQPTVSNQPRSTGSRAPQTGDNSNIMLWLNLLCASAAVLAILGVATRKRRTRE